MGRRGASCPRRSRSSAAALVRSLVVEDGAIVWASSNRRDEQLGVILVRCGLVAERALADALETRAETGVPLGKVLLMSGSITELDLVEILATKIRETVTDVDHLDRRAVRRRSAHASRRDRRRSPSSPIDVCLTVARRRAARMTEIMGMLGADDVDVLRAAERDAATADRWRRRRRREGLGARRRSPQRGRHRRGVLGRALRGVRRARRDGRTPAGSSIDRRPARAHELRRRARGRCARPAAPGRSRRARSRWRAQALHQDPSDAEVRKTFAQIERARVAEVAKQLLARHRVPAPRRASRRPRARPLRRPRSSSRTASTAAGICCRSSRRPASARPRRCSRSRTSPRSASSSLARSVASRRCQHPTADRSHAAAAAQRASASTRRGS